MSELDPEFTAAVACAYDELLRYDNLVCFDESFVTLADCLTAQLPESELLLRLQLFGHLLLHPCQGAKLSILNGRVQWMYLRTSPVMLMLEGASLIVLLHC